MRIINSAIIGVGDFAENVIIPYLKLNGHFNIKAGLVFRKDEINSSIKKFDWDYATTDYNEILGDPNIECVFIATRHNEHKNQIIMAMKAGKHVFTEKPMAMSTSDAEEIARIAGKSEAKLMVGFNRRFSPLIAEMKRTMDEIGNPFIIN